MFELLLCRAPDATERSRILAFQKRQEAGFRDGTDDPDAFLGIGIAEVPEGFDRAELAAWTQTARLLLNLHETITRYFLAAVGRIADRPFAEVVDDPSAGREGPLAHWSREVLSTPEARADWVEPDLAPVTSP